MARYGLVLNGTVEQISLVPQGGEGWQVVPDHVFAGHTVTGGEFHAPPQTSPAIDLAAFRNIWATVPAYIRGPYQYLVNTAQEFIMVEDRESLQELLNSIQPTSVISNDPDKLETFNDTLAQLAGSANDT